MYVAEVQVHSISSRLTVTSYFRLQQAGEYVFLIYYSLYSCLWSVPHGGHGHGPGRGCQEQGWNATGISLDPPDPQQVKMLQAQPLKGEQLCLKCSKLSPYYIL